MLNEPMDILKAYPIRKTHVQKDAFRLDMFAYIKSLGYECRQETFRSGGQNIIIGDSQNAGYLITAHYDTPASIGIANVCTPCSALRSRLQFIVTFLLSFSLSLGAGLLIKAGYVIPGILMFAPIVAFLYLIRSGPANVNNANDNTSGVVTLLEIARTLPEAHRNKVCFILFDLEEKGLKGSAAYRKAHKEATENQLVLNLDCVGDGDHILFMPTKKARKELRLLRQLKHLGGWFGKKQILVIDKGFCSYNSDHKNFPLAVGIGAFKKKGKHFVLDKIHTKQDVNLDMTNVNLLRAALITFISGDAVN